MTDLDRILQRIQFNPKAELGAEEDAQIIPISWPIGLAPMVMHREDTSETDPLPQADVLVVTYTTAEGQALADVLSPGHESSSWTKYRNGWPALKSLIEGHRAPALESDCAGVWTEIMIGATHVVLVKSDLHPATDGAKLPMVNFWQRMIAQVKPDLVITTGTAGGVGAATDLGDVIVALTVEWDCKQQFAGRSFAHTSYACTEVSESRMGDAHTLLQTNASHVPQSQPLVRYGDTITTDFFAFDTADDHYGLRATDSHAFAVEMDDAALGLAIGSTDQAWVSVRNASDPGNLSGPSLEAEDKQAASIYQKYGYWTTVNSAIVCWAVIAGLSPA